MDQANMNAGITKGADVYGSDGEKVGSIVEVWSRYAVVEKGFLFQTDYYIPTSAFAGVRDNRLYLNVTKDEALNQGWDARPDEDATPAAGVRYDPADDVLVDATGAVPAGSAPGGITGDPVAAMGTDRRVRIAPHEVGQPVGPAETVLEEDVIEFPVYGEEVQAQTRLRVAEEVEVSKEAVQLTKQVAGTVRHEDVRVVGHVVETVEGTAPLDPAVVDGEPDR